MRNLIVFSAFCLLSIFATEKLSAQYNFFTGGTVGFNSVSASESDAINNSFTIVPYIGYIVNDNVIAGLGIGYAGSKQGGNDDNYDATGSFVINPFARYRVTPSKQMGFYGELGLRVNLNSDKVFSGGEQVGETGNSTDFGLYLGPGIDYTFADRWVVNALWGALEYTSTTIKDVDGSVNEFGLNLNPANIVFSLNYMF